jgi:hypothetical protein
MAMMMQHMTTKARIFSMVFRKIRLFRFMLAPRLAGEPARFPVTFPSLLFWMVFANKQQEKPLLPSRPEPACRAGLMGGGLWDYYTIDFRLWEVLFHFRRCMYFSASCH